MKVILPILLIFMLLPSPAKGSEPEWLGEYAGDKIPGYEILESIIGVMAWRGGPTEDLDLEKILLELKGSCMKDNGKALINVRHNFSLGVLGFREKSGEIKRVSPGGYSEVIADCVTRVKQSTSMALPSPAKGSEPEWLGTYVGSEIPGYEILKSGFLYRTIQTGLIEGLNSLELKDFCRRKNGKALVNVRRIVSLGNISFRGKSGMITIVTPGAYGTMLADCVTSVRKK